MPQTLVSVIIPTYKRPGTLGRAVESVLHQDYLSLEVIVVDDNEPGSTCRQETERVMARYSGDNRVSYLKHPRNLNGSAARNTGLMHARGSYIAYLDDDDEFLPRKIGNQIAKMEELDETWGACYTSYLKLRAKGRSQISRETRQGDLLTEALMRSLYIQAGSNLLVRKSVARDLGGFDISFSRYQDLEFLVRLLERYKIAYVDTCALIIHYEVREVKRSYDYLKQMDAFFVSKFQYAIDRLNAEGRRKVHVMMALENLRNCVLFNGPLSDGISQLKDSKVKPRELVRFLLYLAHRSLTKTSYGFRL